MCVSLYLFFVGNTQIISTFHKWSEKQNLCEFAWRKIFFATKKPIKFWSTFNRCGVESEQMAFNLWSVKCTYVNIYIHMYKILSISLGVCTNFGSGKVWHNLPLSVCKSFALQYILNSEAKCFIAKQYKFTFVIYFY